jgi:class 3 adenylate cyclase
VVSTGLAIPTDCGAVIEHPETQYAKTAGGVHVAYQVIGDGPLDLVFLPLSTSHVELAWEVPAFARFFRRLASFSRLIRFDYRGRGMSDPLGLSEQPSIEERATEMLAVLDAAGSERAAVVTNGSGGLVAIFFAASHPNRTASLVLDGCYARLARSPDYSWGVPEEVLERAITQVSDARLQGDNIEYTGLRHFAPHAMLDAEFAAQHQRYIRYSQTPVTARADSEMAVYSDVRPLLSAIQAPTLVLYRSGDRFAGMPHAVYLAEHIPDAKLVELPGEDNLIIAGNSDPDLDEIEEFLTGARHAPETDRVLATVLFTDIVGSTERAAELGDRRWRDLLDSHDRTVRRQLERFRGREVDNAGDGFLATFDGPGRAIECACAIRDAVRALGIEVRVGLHTGEIEVRGDDVAGMAVHIGARVAALASANEVLVSRTVTDLVAGSGIEFSDCGEHELKGVPGTWCLYAVDG